MSAFLLTLLAALAGSMLFFAAVVAPTVFRSLPADHAGPFLRQLFPRYYLWGLLLSVGATVTALVAQTAGAISIASAVILLLFVYARQFLVPQINRARDLELDGDAQAGARFRKLHLQSVLINGLQLLLLVAASVYLIAV